MGDWRFDLAEALLVDQVSLEAFSASAGIGQSAAASIADETLGRVAAGQLAA